LLFFFVVILGSLELGWLRMLIKSYGLFFGLITKPSSSIVVGRSLSTASASAFTGCPFNLRGLFGLLQFCEGITFVKVLPA